MEQHKEVTYYDSKIVEKIFKKSKDIREELKLVIFTLGKKGFNNKELQDLLNAAGTLKEVNYYLEIADKRLKETYEKSQEIILNKQPDYDCNGEYITETRLVRNSDDDIKAGYPEYVTQTRIFPNPNYKKPNTDNSSKVVETVMNLPGTLAESINKLSKD